MTDALENTEFLDYCPRANKEDQIYVSACRNCDPEKWNCKVKEKICPGNQ